MDDLERQYLLAAYEQAKPPDARLRRARDPQQPRLWNFNEPATSTGSLLASQTTFMDMGLSSRSPAEVAGPPLAQAYQARPEEGKRLSDPVVQEAGSCAGAS